MGWTYVLKAHTSKPGPFRTLIKIGRTDRKNPRDRTNQIIEEWREKRKIRVEVLSIQKTSHSTEKEAFLHKKYNQYHIPKWDLMKMVGEECNGDTEWFVIPPQVNPHRTFPWFPAIISSVIFFGVISHMKQDKLTLLSPVAVSGSSTELAEDANIRLTPNGRIICQVRKGTRIQVENWNGEWLGVRACGDVSGLYLWKGLTKNNDRSNLIK